MRLAILAATTTVALFGISAASAEVVINFAQVGNDVVASGSGTLDLSGLTFAGTGLAGTGIIPSQSVLGLGPTIPNADYYSGLVGPSSFGTGGSTVSTSTSGDFLGVEAGSLNFLGVPHGFVSGGSLSGSDTFANSTFASLGLTPGQYIYTWNVPAAAFARGFASGDSVIVNIPAVNGVPEVSTWIMMLLGFGILGGFAVRQNQKTQHLASAA